MSNVWRMNSMLVESAHYVRRTMLASRRLRNRERRETSITDDLIVRLTTRGRGVVVAADAPGPESKYGADLELWLRGGGFLLGLRLQAKSLAPRKKTAGSYEHLHHVVRRRSRTTGLVTARPQVDVLIGRTPAYLNPGYLFYNAPERKPAAGSACCSFNGYARKHGRLGLTYASAASVQQLNRMNPRPCGIDDVLPTSVPLQCLAMCFRGGWWPQQAGVPPMPLRAADLPLALAGGGPPVVLLDPTRDIDQGFLEVARRSPLVLDEEVSPPEYVRSLLTNGVLGDDAAPTARRVLVLSEDLLRLS
jgi:hypothetical protein